MTFPQTKQNFARVDANGILPVAYAADDVVALTCDTNGRLFVTSSSGVLIVTPEYIASSDGTLGLTPAVNAAPVKPSADLLGHTWARLWQSGAVVGPVTTANGLMVQGDVAINTAVDTTNPIKVGGLSTDIPAGNPAVAFGRRQTLALDIHGRVVSRMSGWEPEGSVNSVGDNFPILPGSTAIEDYKEKASISAGKITIGAYSRNGAALVATEPRANPHSTGTFSVSCSAYTTGGTLVPAWVVKAEPGRLRRLTVSASVTNDGDRFYVLVLSQSSLPVGGEFPYYSCGWAAGPYGGVKGSSLDITWAEGELYVPEGITIAVSTEPEKFNSAGDNFVISALFI